MFKTWRELMTKLLNLLLMLAALFWVQASLGAVAVWWWRGLCKAVSLMT